MARSKYAAALFEVMADKKGNASGARAPNWWIKNRTEPPAAVVIDPNDPTTTPIKSSLIAPRITAVEETPAPQPVVRSSSPASRLKRDPADPTRAAARPAPESSRAIEFDRMRRELKLRVSLTNAVVAAFAVMMIVALAYVMGKRESAPTSELTTTETTTAESGETPQAAVPVAPIKPKVLEVGKPKKASASATPGPANAPAPRLGAEAPRVKDHEFISMPPVANTTTGMHVNPAAPANAKRTIGINYIIAQSYPAEQTAKDARDFLMKNGITCTVEKGTGFAPNWYSVVTSRGFEHIHTNECENFKSQIDKLGEKFADNGKFNKFEPMLYSWRAPEAH
jgi:hypothetical protein